MTEPRVLWMSDTGRTRIVFEGGHAVIQYTLGQGLRRDRGPHVLDHATKVYASADRLAGGGGE